MNESQALTGTFMFTTERTERTEKKVCNLSSIDAAEDLTKLEESSLILQDTAK